MRFEVEQQFMTGHRLAPSRAAEVEKEKRGRTNEGGAR